MPKFQSKTDLKKPAYRPTRALFSGKARCFSQSERALYGNFIINQISKWFNRLTLNESKFVLFGGTQKLKSFKNVSLCINDSQLGLTDSFKYLGVFFNHDHVHSIIKVNQRLGVLRRVKHMLPRQARFNFYNSLDLPLFDYGDMVWGDKNGGKS